MDSLPKTRQEKKKDQKKKARPETLGTGKGARNKIANVEKSTKNNSKAPSSTQ